jgi:prepilin-type N-terminal cleavage/methylation domain-containing protein/prepilin-type processing-associated H-X9-DG protein
MKTQKQAFTLIELLVVIAIIAILAAILFPVFAQAKAAAKAIVGVSNLKQINLAIIMYGSDFDDNRVPRVSQDLANCNAQGNGCTVVDEHSWKELVAPYVKSVGMYSDPQNSLNNLPDLHSDPAARALYNWTPITLPANLTFARSYSLVNEQTSGPGNFVNSSAVPLTLFQSPSTTGLVTETHDGNADIGPYEGWYQLTPSDYGDGTAPWQAIAPSEATGKWDISGDAYSDKAANAGFMDGHAKREGYSVRDCFSTNEGPTGTQPDFYNISGADLASSNNGYTWEATNCAQLPAAFK